MARQADTSETEKEDKAYAVKSRSQVHTNKGNNKNMYGVCYKCGKPGHFARNCRTRKGNHQQRVQVHAAEDFYVKAENREEANKVQGEPRQRWCLDSGCTTYMCGDDSILENKVTCDSVLKLATDASTAAKVKGVAKIAISGGQTQTENLHDTLYVPNLRTNLVSVSKITDNKMKIIFNNKSAVVTNADGKTVMVADRIGDLYFVREKNHAEQAQIVTRATSQVKLVTKNSSSLWHKRLGHLLMIGVIKLCNDELATGINISREGQSQVCEVCCRGKLAAKPFEERSNRSRTPLEIIHSDICGPMRTLTNGRARYMITFIDDCSTWGEVYCLKSKDEALGKFKQFKNCVETFTGHKIKYLPKYNGREYCNNKFEEYLNEAGISTRSYARRDVIQRFKRQL